MAIHRPLKALRARLLLLPALLFAAGAIGQYSVSEINSVELSATAQSSPARITLAWPSWPGATGYTVYRKLRTATSWGSTFGTATGSSTGFTDNSPSVNTLYEYKVVRAASNGTGYGYLCAGIEVQPTDYSGKLVLLVDNTLAAGLSTELTQLQNDLKADGWVVLRHDVAPSATVTSVRALVQADYTADATNVKAVYSVGHVPVPYSGNIAPDGHTSQHQGAWPCDSYYGEMNGTWTDNSVNNSNGWPDNRNVPGDGKFDQNDPPGTVELQVGRADLHDMTAFSSNETQLVSAYLTRAHNFKTKAFTPLQRGIIYDDLQDVPTPLAGAGWKSISALVGAANITEATPSDAVWMRDLVNGQSYLWSYGSGGGLIGNDNGVLMFNYLNRNVQTTDLAGGVNWGAVFNMQYGSYIGDWNNRNNVMRALLTSGSALGSVYSGVPNYFFHTMGMNETIGKAVLTSVNNTTLYIPQSGGDVTPDSRGAMGLMGDPTLRLLMAPMPTNVSVTNSGGNAAFSWTAAPGATGYYVYAFNASGVPQRLNTTAVTGTSYTSTHTFSAGELFMVRTVQLQTSPSGSYYNLSLGAFGTAGTTNNVLLAPRMLLEGPWDGTAGLMRDDLRAAGLVPLSEPYTALGFQAAGGGGESTTQAVLNVTGNNAVVDWVRVELRSSGAPGTVVAARQALLQRDGDVVSTDGSSPLTFNVAPGNYYVAVRHRNHLGTMRATAIALSGTSTALDFSLPATPTYGANAQKQLDGRTLLYMGNALLDDQLKYTGTGNDRDVILLRIGNTNPNGSVAGYYLEDTNLDGQVLYTGANNDRDPILVNIGSVVPTNTLLQQVP